MMMENESREFFNKQARRYGIVLSVLTLFFFGLIPYGGVRSPDSEVVFRMAETLAKRGGVYVGHDLEDWHAFGVAVGRDQRLYSIFGPLESVLLVPFIKAADLINETGWYNSIRPIMPLSHFTEHGYYDYTGRETTKSPRPHALRMLAAVFNVIVSTLGVFLFWRILLFMTNSLPTSFLISLVYAFGTHIWVYAGTFFSEPLATLFVLLSFFSLLKANGTQPPSLGFDKYRMEFLSGIWLGLALTAHITAILYAPFFALYLFWKMEGEGITLWRRLERASVFGFGVFILLFLLGWYNYYRFGNFFETGRTVSPIAGTIFVYGAFTSPLRGLYGLIFGAGKGVLFYMPVLVLSSFLWRDFFKSDRKLFWILLGALAFRILFLASRTDWHAGFCTGPRYLVMAIPFFLIPLALWLRNRENVMFTRAFGQVAAIGALCSMEQFYLCLCEIFSFLQLEKFKEQAKGFDFFENDVVHLDWKYSPLLNGSKMRIAPFFLANTGLSLGELFLLGSVILLVVFSIVFLLVRGMPRSSDASTSP